MVTTRHDADVAVIGAGSSGLAVLKELRERGMSVECFERGSSVGGLWRYENDSGLSGAYESLRTNVSRRRMQFPSFAMPRSFGDFPSHTDMAEYLDAYADAFGLLPVIRFRTSAERLEPSAGGGWAITLHDGSVRRFGAVVVASGLFWSPSFPTFSGEFCGRVTHSHDYRTPDPFRGRRVLVVGAGQSASEIAVEVSAVAERTLMCVRHGVHVVPRWIGRAPYDAADLDQLIWMPWWLLNRIYAWRVAREIGPIPASWPRSGLRLLEGIPIVSSELLPAVRRGDVVVKPAIDQLAGERVRFVDGSDEPVNDIVYGTGYRPRYPFLDFQVGLGDGEYALYRRIAAVGLEGLFFAGAVYVPGGLLPVVESQGKWIAAVLDGSVRLPSLDQMLGAIERGEKRTRQRFPGESARANRCDPHAYRRLLHADLLRGRLRFARFTPVKARPSPSPGRLRLAGYGRRASRH